MARPRWWYALRGFAVFVAAGGLVSLLYVATTHRPGGMPWGRLLFGAIVCVTISARFPGRRRRVSLPARTKPSRCAKWTSSRERGVVPAEVGVPGPGLRSG